MKTGSTDIMYGLLGTGMVPDFVIRRGIRHMLGCKLEEESSKYGFDRDRKLADFVDELKGSPIAIETDAANSQHYEVPAEFFRHVLGPRMKYSCALFLDELDTLGQAEENMLALYCSRAELTDGTRILDLGCGWGSLCLYLAERYPCSQITALSNSRTQKQYIDSQIEAREIRNLTVVTGNVANFDFDFHRKFDRILSIEMFEHMKNYSLLLERISRWLSADGLLFVHMFTHKQFAYHYEDRDGSDWLARNFFAGGTMPSHDLLEHFQKHMSLESVWTVNGLHYSKTARQWLQNMDRNRSKIMPILESAYGSPGAGKWWMYWRMFFMACEELWGYEQGNQWMVSHYRLTPAGSLRTRQFNAKLNCF